MSDIKIEPGMVFGRLTVTGNKELRHRNSGNRTYRECKCSCGNITWVAQNNLKCGNCRSCGCAIIDVNKSRATHNKTKERIYRTRMNMRVRCNNPKDKSYSRYGGRGIVVCKERDESFDKFYADMGPSYYDHVKIYGEADTQIDRINVNDNYCKENCRRATRKEQTQNRRPQKNGHRYKEYGFTLQDLADKYHLGRGAIQWRLYHRYNGDMDKLIEHLN